MKATLPKQVEDNRLGGEPGALDGACVLKKGSAYLRVIFSSGLGWDHVSVSLTTRCPTWEEMAYVKRVFFEPEEAVMQLHPPESEYVNNYPYCLHLWRPQGGVAIPLPPSRLVGYSDLGTLQQVM